MVCFLIDLDETKQKRSEPEYPFEQRCQHDRGDYRHVYYLDTSVSLSL